MNFSQFGQDIHIINNIFPNKYNGYFVDIGAYDGIVMSNTYLLEKNYGWKGICIEANPRYFNKLESCRTSININNAIYKDDLKDLEFIDDENGGCSGLKDTNNHSFLNNSPIIKVKTRNLTSLLDEYNAPNYIEYLSIDTEGSEFDILNSHNFNKYKFGYITVEHNFIHDNRIKIRNLLIKNGYVLYRENNVDDDYILNKKKGIFYNSKKATCSIYESGLMVYNCLKRSHMYELEYTEDTNFLYNYDFCIVNQHFTVNNWITEPMIKLFNKPAFCVVTEVSFSNNCVAKSPNFFTAYIVLDTTINEINNIYAFPRPLEDNYDIILNEENKIPIIGSFGFATVGKSWHKIVEEVQKEFDEAIIRFNIPYATHIPDNQYRINSVIHECMSVLKNPNIKLQITHNIFSKEELIKWCSQNTINCFFYEREHMFNSGLCATTDQAIVSERPLLVTKDITFRHIHKYIDYYPNISIKQAIQNTINGVNKMKQDWSSKHFLEKFETIFLLYENKTENNYTSSVFKILDNQLSMSAYYHVHNYTESGNVIHILKNLLNDYKNNNIDTFTVSNNIFSDTCPNVAKTLFINININNTIIELAFKENEKVSFNYIFSEINKHLDTKKEKCLIETSIGEIIDKYSILELKHKHISDTNKLQDIDNEIKILEQYVLNIKTSHFYKMLLYINEQIWLDTDVIKELNVNNDYETICKLAEIYNRIFDNNQKRFRLKNHFNTVNKSNIKEHKSYAANSCFINISEEKDIYSKIPEINYLCISYDIIYFSNTYEQIINNLFINTNIKFIKDIEISSSFKIYDLQSFTINTDIKDFFDFNPIKYKSTGKLGDFLNQLSVICENYYKTGKKGELYICDLPLEGDKFVFGVEHTYADTYNTIMSLDFIKKYKIYNSEAVDIDLSAWRNGNVLHTSIMNKENWFHIYNKAYNVNWGCHKWLKSSTEPIWNNKIIINVTPYRFISQNCLVKLNEKIKDNINDCIFISNEKEHYDYFLKNTGLSIEYYKPKNFEETLIIVNSCKIGYFGLSSMAVIANALHKNHYIMCEINNSDYNYNNLKDIIPHVLDIFI
jgi:FkbM family methyltransferase